MAYGTQTINAAFTSALPMLSRNKPIPRTETCLEPLLILFSHLRLGLPKVLFLIGSPAKIMKALLLSNLDMTCPSYTEYLLINKYYSQPKLEIQLNDSKIPHQQNIHTQNYLLFILKFITKLIYKTVYINHTSA